MREQRSKYDISAILDLWASGSPSTDIARKFKMEPEYVRIIVQRARAVGDKRAIERKRGGGNRFGLSTTAYGRFAEQALRRDVSEGALATMLLEMISSEGLFEAVLEG